MTSTKNGRMPRGSNPPFILFSEALRLAQAIWENGGGQFTYDMLSRLTGNSSSSSSFIKKLNALKAYGLVNDSGNIVALTDQGRDAVAPISPSIEAAARKSCFLNIEVYSKLYERHKGKLLPADEFLKNIIEQECRIPKDLLDAWIPHFKDAAATAGLLFRRSDGKYQIAEEPIIAPQSESGNGVEPSDHAEQAPTNPTKEDPPISVPFVSSSGHTTKIELSSKRYAIFSFPDSLTARDAQKLKGALSGLSAIIDSMVDDQGDLA